MKIVFMGTPDFAVVALEALVKAGYDVVAVYTQPPRPAGRGKHVTPSPVHRCASSHGLPIFSPVSLKSAEVQAQFRSLRVDIVVVAAYGLIIPKPFLDHCYFINIHASLLPRWRGAAPIQRAILAGDKQTGVTIMQMNEGLDTGAMLLRHRVAITPEMNARQLHDVLAQEGGTLCLEALDLIKVGKHQPVNQPAEGVTYAHKIKKSEALIDWTQGARQIHRQIRAFNPYPGAYMVYEEYVIKILEADYRIKAHRYKPGEVIDGQLTVAAADGFIVPKLVQREGRRIMTVKEFIKGRRH